jgi:hypothetical protein
MRSVNRELKVLKNVRKKDLPEEAKACHYPLRKNQEDITTPQQETLAAVYQADAMLNARIT